jgi:hypothetical protein
MEASADAAALSRSLYGMARARVTGVVSITAKERRCQLLLAGGHVRAILGSASLSATDAESVCARMAEVLRWGVVRCQLEASARASERDDGAPEAMAELLLRAAEAGLPDAASHSGELVPTAFGRALMQAGVELEARSRAAVWIAALVQAKPENRRAYGLLVRKREQLRRCVSPRELLELEPYAEASEARKALRRLAAKVHPDALGPAAPALLQGASSELICELVRAENALRGARA